MRSQPQSERTVVTQTQPGTSLPDPQQPTLPETAQVSAQGLSEAEAARRKAAGQSNVTPATSTRSYRQIVVENVFNFINNVLFILGGLLIILGRYGDAAISVGVVVCITLVSLIQEIRAKILLDRIAILTRPQATIVRDGRRRDVDPAEVVLGDVLVLRAGDQAVVDGSMLGDGRMEMDESLLTGESDPVPKRDGDEVFSGSFCVTGGGSYVAGKVGTETLVYKLTAGAQAFRRVLTPLQARINTIIRSFFIMAILLEMLLIIRAIIDASSFTETVRYSVVIIGLVPNGLVLSIALAYALGAVRMAGKGALVQQGNAVESISNVDVLCSDKTGTLTTNVITFHDLHPLHVDRIALEQLLGDFAASASHGNRTTDAVRAAFGGTVHPVLDEAVFSSARKWSGLVLDDDGMRGAYVLGAPEMLQHSLRDGDGLGERFDEWTAQGLRVLLFAYNPTPASLHADSGAGDGERVPTLPAGLVPLGLVCLSDELRPEVESTLRALEDSGVALKIISGDNPQTVAALARQAGFAQAVAVSGADLERLDDTQLRQIAEEASIFGRVTPEQKERLVSALRANGHYVAMIGDGVNDVISLKKANVGIAMQGGSQAARAVADMILLKDSFHALPWAFREGQRIFNGMQDILRVFMVRILTVALLVIAVGFIGGFPFGPRQASLLSFFAGAVPAIAFAAFARPGRADRSRMMGRIMRFSLPPVLIMGLIGLGLYVGYFLYFQSRLDEIQLAPGVIAVGLSEQLYLAQSVLMTFCMYCSLLLLPMIAPPVRLFAGGNPVRRSWIMTILAILLAVGYMFAVKSETGMSAFDIAPLRTVDFVIAGGAAVLWAAITLLTWRHHWLDRFVGLQDEDDPAGTAVVSVDGPPGSGGKRGRAGPRGSRDGAATTGSRKRMRRYTSRT